MGEKLALKTKISIYRFKDPSGEIYRKLRGGTPAEEMAKERKEEFVGYSETTGNKLLNCGAARVIDLMIGQVDVGGAWSHENAEIGVGDGTTPEDPSQTGLTGTNQAYAGMDSEYPKRQGDVQVVFQATFGLNEAAFTWNEFVVRHKTDMVCLNRKVSAQGTKPADEIWTVVVTITLQ